MRLKPQVLQLVTAFLMIALSHAVPLNRYDSEGNSLHLDRRNETSFDREFSSVCVIDDVIYQTGDPVPPPSPCERCTCQPPTISCSPVQCDYKPNCKALKMSNQCCTVYQCECEHNGRLYQNGERLETPENPCDVCYCRGGEVSCTRIECYKRDDCEPQYVPGRCCPKYDHCPPIDQPRHEKTRPQYVRTEFNRDSSPPVNQVVNQRTGLLDLDNEASEDVTATALPTESFDQHTISPIGSFPSVNNTGKHSPIVDDTENYTNTAQKLPTNILDDEARLTSEVSESQLTDSHKASSVLKLVPISPEDPETGTTAIYSSSEEGSGTISSEESISALKEGTGAAKTSASSSETELEITSDDGEGSGSEQLEQRTESNLPTTLISGKNSQEIFGTPDIATESEASGRTTVLPVFRSGLLDTTVTADESIEITETVDKELTTEALFINLRANTNPASTSQEEETVALRDSTDRTTELKEADNHNIVTTEDYNETTKITANATLEQIRQKESESVSNSEEGSGDSTTEFKSLEDEATTVIPERLQEPNRVLEHTDQGTSEMKTESGVDLTNPPTDASLTSDILDDNARVKIVSSSNAVRIFTPDKDLAADQAPEGTVTESATVSFTNLENGLLGLPIAQDLMNNVMDVVFAVTEEPDNKGTLVSEGKTTENIPTEAMAFRKGDLDQKVEAGKEPVTELTEIPTATKDEITTVIPSMKLQKSSLLQADDSSIDSSDTLLTTTEVTLQDGITDKSKSSSNQQEDVDLTTVPSQLDEITVTTEKSEIKNFESVTTSAEFTTSPSIQTSAPLLRIAEDSGNTNLGDLSTEQITDTQSSGTEQSKLENIKITDEATSTLSTESETTTMQSSKNNPDIFVRLASETSDVKLQPVGTTSPDQAQTELPESTTPDSEEATTDFAIDKGTAIIDYRMGWRQQDTTEKITPLKSQENNHMEQTSSSESATPVPEDVTTHFPSDQDTTIIDYKMGWPQQKITPLKSHRDETSSSGNSDRESPDYLDDTTSEINPTNIPEDVTVVLPGISNLKERTAIKLSAIKETESTTEVSKDEEQSTSTDGTKQLHEEATTAIPAEPSTIIPEAITGEQSVVKERFAQSEDFKSTILPQEESTVTQSEVETTVDETTERYFQSTDSLQVTGTRNVASAETEHSDITQGIPTTYKTISVEPRKHEVSSSSQEQQSDQGVTTDINLDTTVSLVSVKNKENSTAFPTAHDQSTTEGIARIFDSMVHKHHESTEMHEPSQTEQSSLSVEQDSTESTTSNAQEVIPMESVVQEHSKEKIEEISESSTTEQSIDSTEQIASEFTTKQYSEDTLSSVQDDTNQKSTLIRKTKEKIQESPLLSPTEQSIESTEQDYNESTTKLDTEDISSSIRGTISKESIKDDQSKEENKISESSTEHSIALTEEYSESTTESNIKDFVPLASDIQENSKEIQQEISTTSAVSEHEEVEITTLPREWLKSDSSSETDDTSEEVNISVTDVSTQAVSLTTEKETTEKSIFGSIPRRNNSTSHNETASADQPKSMSAPDSSTLNKQSDEHVAKARSINNFDVNLDNDNSFITPQEGLAHSSHSRYASSYTSNIDGFPVLEDFFTRLFHHRDEEQPAVF